MFLGIPIALYLHMNKQEAEKHTQFKTHTVSSGLVQRSLSFYHNSCDESKLTFFENYNDNKPDLYQLEKEINIREDPILGVTVDYLSVMVSHSLMDSLEFYRKGIANRKTTPTQMNETSSRIHSICTINLEMKSRYIIRRSKLCYFVSAGSD